MEQGFSEEYGARDLQRAIKKYIGLPIADEILRSKAPVDGTCKFDLTVRDGEIEVINSISTV